MGCNPAIQGTFVSHDFIDHETNTGATENEKNIFILPAMIDGVLEYTFYGRILLSEKREFVNNQHGTSVWPGVFIYERQGFFPVRKWSNIIIRIIFLDRS